MKSDSWSWQGAVGFILAIAVFTATVILSGGLAFKIAFNGGIELNPIGISILTGVLMTLVGAISGFLGKTRLSNDNPGADADLAEHAYTNYSGIDLNQVDER